MKNMKLKKTGRFAAVLALVTATALTMSGCLTTLVGVKVGQSIADNHPEIGSAINEFLGGNEDWDEVWSDWNEWEDETTEAADSTEEAEIPDYAPEESNFEEGLTFTEFTDSVFAYFLDGNTLNVHFFLTDPEAYGIDAAQATWGDPVYSEEDSKEYESWLYDALSYLKNYDKDSMTTEEQLVYDMLESYCMTELSSIGLELYYEPLGPNSGFQAQLPIYLAEYSFGTEQDVINYLALLEQLPEYFGGLVRYEEQKAEAGLFMEDALLDNVLDQCSQFMEGREDSFLYANFDQKVEALGLDKETTEAYKARNAELVESGVYAAYDILVEGLEALRGSNVYAGGLCNYPDGYDYYSYMVKSSVGTSKTPLELCELLDDQMENSITRLQLIYRRNPDVYEEWLNLEYPSTDPNLIMKMLIEATKEDYPDLSDVEYNIDYVDSSLREYLSPACYFIPPVDTNTVNNILINCDRGDEAEDIFLTMAHEGYPGHLYQTNYLKEHSDLVLHQLLGTNGFAEGWAEYIELNAYSLIEGVSDEAAEFAKINDFVTLCIYARADLGVHAQGWDKNDVLTLVEEYFGEGNEEAAEWIYEYVLGDPGGYLDYVIGSIEIESIRTQAAKEDGYTLKGFHEELLNLSGAPFDIIRKYMFE